MDFEVRKIRSAQGRPVTFALVDLFGLVLLGLALIELAGRDPRGPKIHLAADVNCSPLTFVRTAGQAGDAPACPASWPICAIPDGVVPAPPNAGEQHRRSDGLEEDRPDRT
ncbi:hypothetical protein [Streptomyces sp. NPDC127084]|uniref:hypothetical protein n=1 Tax=Streptomyces sp. NPDC127084 TaxID=3347133 RepID=UPI003664364F